MVHIFQGTKIKEGTFMQHQVKHLIEKSRVHDTVISEFKVPLINHKNRSNHKVDIFCKNDNPKKIIAYNVKSRATNNTESGDSILHEYNSYLSAIQSQFPGYIVSYEILKLSYNNKLKNKFAYLNSNGFPVHDLTELLRERYNIPYEDIAIEKENFAVSEMIRRIGDKKISRNDIFKLFLPDLVSIKSDYEEMFNKINENGIDHKQLQQAFIEMYNKLG